MKLFTLQLVEQCKQVRELINFHSMAQLHFIFRFRAVKQINCIWQNRKNPIAKNIHSRPFNANKLKNFSISNENSHEKCFTSHTTHPSHHYNKYSILLKNIFWHHVILKWYIFETTEQVLLYLNSKGWC